MDLIDGYRWKILTDSLTIFNFIFDIISWLNLSPLDSFRTPFWLEEKCWYVSSQNGCVFSMPYFFSTHVDINTWTCVDPRVGEFEIDTTSFNSMNIKCVRPPTRLPYYTHIKKLSINCSILLENISSIVDLKQVRHLSILSITDLLIFQPYKSTIPNVYELTIKNAVTFHEIEQFKGFQFEQIKNLSVSISDKDRNFIEKGLFYCFPQIEYLTYSSTLASIKILTNVIDEVVHLTNVSFYFYHQPNTTISDPYFNSNYIIQNSQRLNENNFTCRVQQVSSSSFNVHCWIAPQVSLYSFNKNIIFSLYIFILLCSRCNHLQLLSGRQD
jgi:hypothetical protein